MAQQESEEDEKEEEAEEEERRDVDDDKEIAHEKEIAQEEPVDEKLASTDVEPVPAETISKNTTNEDVKAGPEGSTPTAAAKDSITTENKSKSILLLKDLEDKEVKRKAKFDKISDFEAYLASVTTCVSDKGEAGEPADHFVASAFGAAVTTPTLSSAGEQRLQFLPNVSITTSKEDLKDDQANNNLPSFTEDRDIVLDDSSVTKIDSDPDANEEKTTIDDAEVEENGEETKNENQKVDFDVDVKQENNNASGLTRAVVHISRT